MLVYLLVWKGLGEVNAAVDTLHSHGVLLVLIEVAKDGEEILLWYQRNQLNHVVENEGGTLSYLRDIVLWSLSK